MKIKSYILVPLKASASNHLAIMRLSLCYHFIVIENMGKESLTTLVEETHSLSDYFQDVSDAIWEKKIYKRYFPGLQIKQRAEFLSLQQFLGEKQNKRWFRKRE